MAKQLHDIEVKIRLTENDASVLTAIARREGIPVATLARQLVKRQLRRMGQPTPALLAD
jgi:hypothetical protein